MRRARQQCFSILAPLLALALTSVPASAAAGANPRLVATRSLNAWVATDLDGDRKVDLATTGVVLHQGNGFVQDITVRLGGIETSFPVNTALRARRLTARDVDGDADRDLVLEAFDREPLAVLLNDGGGHFHLADLTEFRGKIPRREPRSFEALSLDSGTPEAGEDAGNPSPELAPSGFCWYLVIAGLRLESVGLWPLLGHSTLSNRGPPLA